MIKNLKLYNFIILLIPVGLITGPLILEILLLLTTVSFFLNVNKKDFIKLGNNFFFQNFFYFFFLFNFIFHNIF